MYKLFNLSLVAADFEQILYFKGFVMEEAKYFLIYFFLTEWQLIF